MKRLVPLLIVAILVSTAASAQAYKLGLGVRLSNKAPVINNSISLKYFFSENTALETLFSLGDPLALGLMVEQHRPLNSGGFYWFYGGGAYGAFKGERRAGLQGVVGLDYKMTTAPVNFSLDWKPELTLTREFSFEPAAVGISARFTLK